MTDHELLLQIREHTLKTHIAIGIILDELARTRAEISNGDHKEIRAIWLKAIELSYAGLVSNDPESGVTP